MIVYASYSSITFEFWSIAGGGTLIDTYTILGPSNLFCEDFNAFTVGTNVGADSEWYDEGNGPVINATGGVANGQGLDPASAIFTWIEHDYDWNATDFHSVKFQMDFQTNENAQFNDDRVGWMTNNASINSDSIFGVQLDYANNHLRMEGYWDNIPGDDAGRVEMADLDAAPLVADSWYQLIATITKLGPTSAQLDAELWSWMQVEPLYL